MKVVKNDNNRQPLTLAELEALRQFEQSDHSGQALFRPEVAAGRPVPDCVLFLERIGRFGMTALPGQWFAGHDQRVRRDADATGADSDSDDALEDAWQAAQEVLHEFKRKRNHRLYTFAVAWFPDMEPDQGIMDATRGRGVYVLFGQEDLIQRLVNLPDEEKLQTKLSSWYIEQEVAALRGPSAAAEPKPAEGLRPVNGRVPLLDVGRVETMNVYITVVNSDDDDDAPPLITVQGQ